MYDSQNLARKVLQTIEGIAVEVLCLIKIFGYSTRLKSVDAQKFL